MLLNPEHPEKADVPMFIMEDEISMLVSPLHPLKDISPIVVTDDGIIVEAHPKISLLLCVSMIALQFSLES